MMQNTEVELIKRLEDLSGDVPWRKFTSEGLDVDYAVFLSKNLADDLFSELENTLEYYDGDLKKVISCFVVNIIPNKENHYI